MCTVLAVAEASGHFWPDGVDWSVTAGYLALIVGVAVMAYVSMSLHIRDYFRSLRRALVVISQYRLDLPEWIRRDRPRCLEALGLSLPCTSEDVLVAYRQKVKLLHPDRGGDTRESCACRRISSRRWRW